MALDAWAAIAMFAGVGLVIVAGLRDHVVAWAHETDEYVDAEHRVRRTVAALGATLVMAGGTLLLLGGVLGTA